MKRKGSYLAGQILKDYKKEQYMSRKVARLKKLSNNKTGIVKEEQNIKKQVEVDG